MPNCFWLAWISILLFNIYGYKNVLYKYQNNHYIYTNTTNLSQIIQNEPFFLFWSHLYSINSIICDYKLCDVQFSNYQYSAKIHFQLNPCSLEKNIKVYINFTIDSIINLVEKNLSLIGFTNYPVMNCSTSYTILSDVTMDLIPNCYFHWSEINKNCKRYQLKNYIYIINYQRINSTSNINEFQVIGEIFNLQYEMLYMKKKNISIYIIDPKSYTCFTTNLSTFLPPTINQNEQITLFCEFIFEQSTSIPFINSSIEINILSNKNNFQNINSCIKHGIWVIIMQCSFIKKSTNYLNPQLINLKHNIQFLNPNQKLETYTLRNDSFVLKDDETENSICAYSKPLKSFQFYKNSTNISCIDCLNTKIIQIYHKYINELNKTNNKNNTANMKLIIESVTGQLNNSYFVYSNTQFCISYNFWNFNLVTMVTGKIIFEWYDQNHNKQISNINNIQFEIANYSNRTNSLLEEEISEKNSVGYKEKYVITIVDDIMKTEMDYFAKSDCIIEKILQANYSEIMTDFKIKWSCLDENEPKEYILFDYIDFEDISIIFLDTAPLVKFYCKCVATKQNITLQQNKTFDFTGIMFDDCKVEIDSSDHSTVFVYVIIILIIFLIMFVFLMIAFLVTDGIFRDTIKLELIYNLGFSQALGNDDVKVIPHLVITKESVGEVKFKEIITKVRNTERKVDKLRYLQKPTKENLKNLLILVSQRAYPNQRFKRNRTLMSFDDDDDDDLTSLNDTFLKPEDKLLHKRMKKILKNHQKVLRFQPKPEKQAFKPTVPRENVVKTYIENSSAKKLQNLLKRLNSDRNYGRKPSQPFGEKGRKASLSVGEKVRSYSLPIRETNKISSVNIKDVRKYSLPNEKKTGYQSLQQIDKPRKVSVTLVDKSASITVKDWKKALGKDEHSSKSDIKSVADHKSVDSRRNSLSNVTSLVSRSQRIAKNDDSKIEILSKKREVIDNFFYKPKKLKQFMKFNEIKKTTNSSIRLIDELKNKDTPRIGHSSSLLKKAVEESKNRDAPRPMRSSIRMKVADDLKNKDTLRTGRSSIRLKAADDLRSKDTVRTGNSSIRLKAIDEMRNIRTGRSSVRMNLRNDDLRNRDSARIVNSSIREKVVDGLKSKDKAQRTDINMYFMSKGKDTDGIGYSPISTDTEI